MRVSKRNRQGDAGEPAKRRGERAKRQGERAKRQGERAKRLAGALREGGRETRERLDGRPTDLFSRLLSGLGSFAALAAEMLRGLGRMIAAGAGSLARGPLAGAGRRAEAAVAVLSRLLSPVRMLVAVAIGCAVLLALSQFADYRGVAVGTDSYAGVESVAPAPEIDRAETGSAHSYAFVPAAAIAILLLALAARSRRWQLCRLVALIGVAAIVVAIVVDRPAGLDEGELARQFAGVEARLLGGYWMQIFAGVGLAATSMLLGSELRRLRPEGAPRQRPGRRRPATPASASPSSEPRGARA